MPGATFSALLDNLNTPQPPRPDPEATYRQMVRDVVMGRLPAAEHARDTLELAHRTPGQLARDVATMTTDHTLAALMLRVQKLASQHADGRQAVELRTVARRLELAAKVLSADHPLADAADDDLAAFMADWPTVEAENPVEDLAERLRTFAGTLHGSTAALDCRSLLLAAAARIEVALGTATIAESKAAELLRA